MLAVLQGEHRRAMRLCGAASALREEIGAPRPASDQAALDEMLQPVRAAAGEVDREEAWAEGRALPLDRAVAEALRE